MYDLCGLVTQLREKPSASALLDQATAFQSILEQWSRLRENHGNSNPLVTYILEDEEAGDKSLQLCDEIQTGIHKHRAKFLQQQCIKNKVCFWLARLSSTIDRRYYGAAEPIFKLDEITELDGTVVMRERITIEKEDIVEINSFDCREASDAEKYWEIDDTCNHFKDRVCYILTYTTILSGIKIDDWNIPWSRSIAYRGFAG